VDGGDSPEQFRILGSIHHQRLTCQVNNEGSRVDRSLEAEVMKSKMPTRISAVVN
jgi:hypothetical protein